MAYEEDYFSDRKYQDKAELIRRHILSVLHWASRATGIDLLKGQGRTALDVGCAYGYASRVLTGLGYETVGIDISGWGVRRAKSENRQQFLVCDAQVGIPFMRGVFDLVTCFDVLEHLGRPEIALSNMYEASRGVLICTTPNKKVEKPIRKLLRDFDDTHISTKTHMQWQQLVKNNLGGRTQKVEAFYDFTVQFGGKLFFNSFHIPRYGLTIRIVVGK